MTIIYKNGESSNKLTNSNELLRAQTGVGQRPEALKKDTEQGVLWWTVLGNMNPTDGECALVYD